MASGEKHPSPRASHTMTASFAVLILVTFFTALYMKGLNSGIPLYYDSIGYSATIGGTFVAVFTLASTAMRLIGGQLTDHFSHYRVLMASLAGLMIGTAIPALWENFYVVMVSRVLQGASFALATNVMTVAVMSSASLKHIGKRVGIKGAGTSLGTMLGALVATWLLDGVGYHGFFAFYTALMLLAMLAVFALKRFKRSEAPVPQGPTRPDTQTSTPAEKPSFKQSLHALIAPYLLPQVAPYMAISFVRRIPKGFCISFILIFAKHMGIAMGAAFFIVAGATTLLCRLLGGKLFDSNRTWLLLPLISVQILGFGLLALMPSFATLMVAAVGYGLSVGTTSPFIKTLSAKATPKEHWGVVNGELYFFGDMGKALGAFCGGLLIDATSKACVPQIALGLALLTATVTAVALWLGHRAAAKRARA